MARRDVSAQEWESTEEKARERVKGDVPDHVFCVKDHTGLVTVLHIMVERANVLYHLIIVLVIRDTSTADFLITSARLHCNFLNLCVRRWRSSFLLKDSWNSALGILEQLHADDDGRPFNPSASSWENPVGLDAEMEIDRNVDMPPAEPTVVEASPTASERKEITNWLQKIHQQIGHRDNRTLVRLLKQRGTHPCVLKMAHDHRCSACEESKPPALRHITSSYVMPDVSLWLMLAHVLRWSLCLRKLENVQIVTIKLQSARNPC